MALNAWFFAWNFLLEIPTGAVADFFGRKWSLVLGAIVTACGCLVYVSVPRLAVFLVAEVVIATGSSLVSGADEALLYDTLVVTGRAADANRRIARLNAAQLFGIVTGALSGGLIARVWGVRAPLGCHAVPMTLAAILAATLHEPTAPVATDRTRPYRTLVLSGLRRLRGDRRLRVLVADMILPSAFVWTLIWLYQPLLARVGVAQTWFGVVHAGLCVSQIGVLRSIERLVPLAGGRARYLRAAGVVAAVAMLGLGWAASAPLTIGLLVVAMGTGLTRMPLASNTLNAALDADVRATVLSTVSMLRTLAICVVNPIAGALADRSLGGAMWLLGGATLAVAVLSPLREHHLTGARHSARDP